jgi:hypothetical protein
LGWEYRQSRRTANSCCSFNALYSPQSIWRFYLHQPLVCYGTNRPSFLTLGSLLLARPPVRMA